MCSLRMIPRPFAAVAVLPQMAYVPHVDSFVVMQIVGSGTLRLMLCPCKLDKGKRRMGRTRLRLSVFVYRKDEALSLRQCDDCCVSVRQGNALFIVDVVRLTQVRVPFRFDMVDDFVTTWRHTIAAVEPGWFGSQIVLITRRGSTHFSCARYIASWLQTNRIHFLEFSASGRYLLCMFMNSAMVFWDRHMNAAVKVASTFASKMIWGVACWSQHDHQFWASTYLGIVRFDWSWRTGLKQPNLAGKQFVPYVDCMVWMPKKGYAVCEINGQYPYKNMDLTLHVDPRQFAVCCLRQSWMSVCAM